MIKLTTQNVKTIFSACLYGEGENLAKMVTIEGVIHKYGLHPDRLEANRKKIKELLLQLPVQFRKTTGGGWSFLQACENIEGQLWTGEHMIMEQLFVLGMAIKLVDCQLSREVWSLMPGGMPYYVVNL